MLYIFMRLIQLFRFELCSFLLPSSCCVLKNGSRWYFEADLQKRNTEVAHLQCSETTKKHVGFGVFFTSIHPHSARLKHL